MRRRKGTRPMRYLIALVCPPLAVLLCGKPGKALLNCLFTLCFIVPGIIHALLLVADHKADVRAERIMRAGVR
jgi:uncharacterized membrane protein YqaE (UPF0057 family)